MSDLNEAIKIFNQGGIVIFPTDTAFGIGCRIDNERAIKKLFEIRKRPLTQAVPVLVDSVLMAKIYVKEIPEDVLNKLIKPYWPGALTIVLSCREDKVFSLVRGGGVGLGIREPNFPPLLEIIRSVGVPILGPSANFHGDKTPYKIKDLNPELVSLADYVLKGECLGNLASTVIDCTKKPWSVLRKGTLDIKI